MKILEIPKPKELSELPVAQIIELYVCVTEVVDVFAKFFVDPKVLLIAYVDILIGDGGKCNFLVNWRIDRRRISADSFRCCAQFFALHQSTLDTLKLMMNISH